MLSRPWLSLRLSAPMRGLIAINLAAIIFGTAALYGKLDVSPFWICAMRAGFALLALAMIGGLSSQLLRLQAHSWGILAASGCLLATHWVAFFMSVQLSGIAIATLTFATFPLFTVMVEAAAQRRLPSSTEVVAGCAIIAAVALLLEPNQSNSNNLAGISTGLSSAVSYALFWRITQQLQQPLPAASVSLCQNGFVLLLLVPFLVLSTPLPVTAVEWLALMGLGVFNTAVMLMLYLYALRYISASTCSGFVALEPVYAILFAAWLFDEAITPWILLSIILIIGASLILLKTGSQPT